jgi:glycosyltransferase involved in cell wall biosynthesis
MSADKVHVDVVVPLYNNAAYIIPALASVMAQTHAPFRVFMVDDGSTDDGPARVADFIDSHSASERIHLIRQPNKGPNSARNQGLRMGSSPFVAFLDADDLWHPTKLERQIACFRTTEFRHTVLVHCGAHAIGPSGEQVPMQADKTPIPRGDAFHGLLVRNTVPGGSSAVMIRRTAFDEVGYFDEHLLTSEDHDMWLRLAQVGEFDHAPYDLVGLRRHAANTSWNALRMLEGLVAFNAKWMHHGRQRPDVMRYWGHLIALFAARVADQRMARRTIRQNLDAADVRALARKTFGSMELYILLKRLRARITAGGS